MSFKTTYILFGILAVVVGAFVWTMWIGPTDVTSTNFVLPSMHKEGSPLDPKDITRVEIERTKPNEEKIVFVRDAAGDRWRIVEPRDYRADSAAVDGLIRQIYDASLVKDSDAVNNPSQYGLATPAEIITLGKEGREVKLNVGDTSPGHDKAVVYVTSSDRKEVMAVPKNQLDNVKKSLGDFRARDLLSPASGDIQAFTLTELNKDKVTKGPIELKKGTEEHWTYVKPDYGDAQVSGADPAANDKAPTNVQSVLTDLSNLKVDSGADFVASDVKDLGEYHLDPAKDDILRIEIERIEEIAKNEEGEKEKKTAKVALVIGVGKKVDDKSDQYYAYLDDAKHKDVVKVSARSVARFLQLLDHKDALRDRNLVALGNFRKPDAIDIQSQAWGLLEFRHTSDAQKPWKLWRKDKSYTVDTQTIEALISSLTGAKQIGEFPDPAKKAQLGLDKPDVVVTIWADSLPKDDKKDDKKDKKPEPKDKSKAAVTLSFGFRQGNDAAVERKRGDEKTGTILLVSGKVLDQVREGPLAYLDKQLPPFNENRFNAVANVTKLTLARDGTTFEISHADKPDAPWKFEKPSEFAGRTADRQTIEDILRTLNALTATKIVEDKIPADAKLTEWGLKTPSVKAIVTLTKDGKPKTFEYDFGKEADAAGVYLRTSQQDTIVVVSNAILATLRRELRDPTVFQFDVAKVKGIKLTGWTDVVGKSNPYVLDVKRDKNGSDWIVEKPANLKIDVEKLQRLLTELSHLNALKFVAHKGKPTAAQGLEVAEGALKIEITVDGEKEPLQLTVGKPDGGALFAISNKLPGDVFDVRKDIFEGPKSKPAYFDK